MSDRIAKEDFVSAAVAALSSTYQPLDSDLTAIAALTTTAFGRGLLVLANPADATKFLDGTGAFSVPTSGGAIGSADLLYLIATYR